MKKPYQIFDIFGLNNDINSENLTAILELFMLFQKNLFEYLLLEYSSGNDIRVLLNEFITNTEDYNEIMLSKILENAIVEDKVQILNQIKEEKLNPREWVDANRNQIENIEGVLIEDYEYEYYRK